jgi:hypothetical protein
MRIGTVVAASFARQSLVPSSPRHFLQHRKYRGMEKSGKAKGAQWRGQWWEEGWRGGAPSDWNQAEDWRWQDESQSSTWRGGAPRWSATNWRETYTAHPTSGKGETQPPLRTGSGVRRPRDWEDAAAEGAGDGATRLILLHCAGCSVELAGSLFVLGE